MKIIGTALTTHKHANKWNGLYTYCGKKYDDFYFVSDKKTQTPDELKDRIVYCNSERDDYYSGELKEIGRMNFLYDKIEEYDWFACMDDDSCVNVDLIREFLSKTDENTIVAHRLDEPKTQKTIHIQGGATFYISKKIMKQLSPEYTKIKNQQNTIINYGDVLVSIWCKDLNIKVEHCDLLHTTKPTLEQANWNPKTDDIRKHLSFHHINTPEEFKFLHDSWGTI